MKKRLITILCSLALAFASGGAVAGRGGDHHWDEARVLKVEPIYETVRVNHPERYCRNEQVIVPGRQYHSGAPIVAGAILGGVAGHQFGGGSGKAALTAAGALLGAAVADDLTDHHVVHAPRYGWQERCEVVNRYEERQELTGYRVKYKYNGETHWTRTEQYPGDWIRVRVEHHSDHYYR